MAGVLAVTVIALVGTLQAQFDYRAKVVKIEDLTHDVRRVGLKLEESEGFSFTPGQYVFVNIPEYYLKQWNRKYGTDHEQVIRPLFLRLQLQQAAPVRFDHQVGPAPSRQGRAPGNRVQLRAPALESGGCARNDGAYR